MNKNKRVIMLILTDHCNLKCTYCYENACYHSMNYETAVEIINQEFDNFEKGQEGRIEFFGGEALIQFDLLKKIYEYVKEKYPFNKVMFAFTTNGTLMHGGFISTSHDSGRVSISWNKNKIAA